MFQINNINTNTILQIDYNRIIKLIEEPSENLSLSTKISTAETTLKRKIEGISYNVARVKEILIQQTQLNNNINNESPPYSPSSSNNDTRYRKGLSNLAPLVHYKIKEHLTNKELSDKRELSSNVVISEEYLVDLEQTLGSHHNKMVMNKYVEFFMNEYNNNRSVEFRM